MPLSDSIATLEGKFKILSKREALGETTLVVQREDIAEICRLCKESLGFDYLIDISSVDNFGNEPRFEVVYELSTVATNDHLRLKLSVSEDDLSVATVSTVWPTANWHEREIYDMMGIAFTGHPDLRRILMWDGYPYFPLRKDFPLGGKSSDVPEVAFTKPAPLEGGPFVTLPSTSTVKDREPRARRIED
jgi:NADH-quinone oxidoreductase subunit C